ncbi:hypothetical protein GN956_G4088 [Arapaima gigas]
MLVSPPHVKAVCRAGEHGPDYKLMPKTPDFDSKQEKRKEKTSRNFQTSLYITGKYEDSTVNKVVAREKEKVKVAADVEVESLAIPNLNTCFPSNSFHVRPEGGHRGAWCETLDAARPALHPNRAQMFCT